MIVINAKADSNDSIEKSISNAKQFCIKNDCSLELHINKIILVITPDCSIEERILVYHLIKETQ